MMPDPHSSQRTSLLIVTSRLHRVEIAHRCRDPEFLFQEITGERSPAIRPRDVHVCSIIPKGKFFRGEVKGQESP